MRLVLVGDAHLASSDIKTRTDSSSEAGLRKLEAVLSLAQSSGAAAVIFTGDFLHHNRNNYLYLLRIFDLFERFMIPCYTIIGNHDLSGSDLSSRVFAQVRLCFGRWFSHLDRLDLGGGVIVKGVDAYTELGALLPDSDVTLLVTHHWFQPMYSDTLVFPVPQARELYPSLMWILAGHDHALHPVGRFHGVSTIRPGSLVRVSSARDSDRLPTVAVLDTDSGEVSLVPLPGSVPYGELFRQRESGEEGGLLDGFEAGVDAFRSLSSAMGVQDYLSKVVPAIPDDRVRGMVVSDLVSQGYNF